MDVSTKEQITLNGVPVEGDRAPGPAEDEILAQAALCAVGEVHGEGLILTDRDGQIVAVNGMAEIILGWSADKLVGQNCRRFLRCLDANAVGQFRSSCCRSCLAIEGETVRRTVQTAGGRQAVIARSSSVAGQDNDLLGNLCCFTAEPRGGLVDRVSAELLSNVSHELRTPLTSLGVSIELLSSTHKSMSQQDVGHVLEVLHNSTQQLCSLVENLLSASSIQLGCFHFQPELCDPLEIIDEAVNFVQPILTKKRQQLQTHIPDELPLVKVDSRRIQQVIINLLSNASKYTPYGGEVLLTVSIAARQVTVSVRDNGAGIPPEEQRDIFRRFYRSRRLGSDGPRGMGLGLAIVKSIIFSHGGKVGVDSKLGAGATFWFTLPILESRNTRGGGKEL